MSEVQINNNADVRPAVGMNLLQRVTGVIFSPGAAMNDLIEKPRVLLPLILAAVTQLAFYLARYQLYTDYLRQSLVASQGFTQSLTGVAMTPEYMDQSVSMSLKMLYFVTPLGSLFALLMSVVILFAVFKIFGAKGKFKQFFSIVGYGYIITVIYYLITLAASFFTNSLHIDLPLTSLANLFPANMSGSFFFGVAKGIDIFSIWYYCVIGIGLASLSGFRKRNAYILVAAVFVVGLIIAGSTELARGAMLGG